MFRFVAGNIAQGNPEDMEINLPAGTIGIRGTSGIISILNDSMIGGTLGDAAEGSVLVVLLETGGENIHESGLVVTSAGQSVELTTPGFGTVFAPGQAPTIPFIVETSFFSNEQVSLAPSDPNQNEADEAEDGPEGDSADQADQQGENRPGKPGENDGEPPGGGGSPDGEGEYVEGDGPPDGEGEYVEGDGPPDGEGEYVEG